jgi:hypothetical protein
MPQRIKNPKKLTTISGNPRAFQNDCGNNDVIRPTNPNIQSNTHTIITQNKTRGNKVSTPVKKVFVFFSFAIFIQFFYLNSCYHPLFDYIFLPNKNNPFYFMYKNIYFSQYDYFLFKPKYRKSHKKSFEKGLNFSTISFRFFVLFITKFFMKKHYLLA